MYFHSLVNDARQLRFPRTDSGGAQFHHVIKLNAHYLWGLHLMFKVNALDYVVTLEDDLEPSGDFLMWHTHMRPLLLSRPQLFAVLAHPHGPVHDCNFIGARLLPARLLQPLSRFKQPVLPIIRNPYRPTLCLQLSSCKQRLQSPLSQLPATQAWGCMRVVV